MWLATETGFYSIVKAHDPNDDRNIPKVLVRARARKDLEKLIEAYELQPHLLHEGFRTGKELPSGIHHTPHADYPYKIKIQAKYIADIIHDQILDIDYTNFKSMVTRRQGEQRHSTYMKVWSALHDITKAEEKADELEARRQTNGVQPWEPVKVQGLLDLNPTNITGHTRLSDEFQGRGSMTRRWTCSCGSKGQWTHGSSSTFDGFKRHTKKAARKEKVRAAEEAGYRKSGQLPIELSSEGWYNE